MKKINNSLFIIFTTLGMIILIYYGTMFLWFSFGNNVEEWVLTWYETYPELKPLSCEIMKDRKITWYEKWVFYDAAVKAQDEYQKRNVPLKTKKLSLECERNP